MESASKVSKNSLKYFPSTYDEARARFLKLGERYPDGVQDTFRLPSAKDPNLFVDSLFLPAINKSENLLILTSGVHGVEAFTGSAIQQMFLEDILGDQARARTGVLLIHAVNPYGFKYHRRVSENNVDMNRNFELERTLFQHKNENYHKINKLLNPATAVGSRSCLKNIFSLLNITQGLNTADINQAVGQGQYENQKSIMFGGFDFEPQVEFIKTTVQKNSQDYQKVILLDLHTGLGDKNALYLIGSDTAQNKSKNLARHLFSGNDANHRMSAETDNGFYTTYGDMVEFILKVIGPDKPVASATAEFGTIGNGIFEKIRTLFNLIDENQGHHFGYKTPQLEKKVKERFLEIFFPKNPEWQLNALCKSEALLRQVLSRLDQS